VADPTPVGIVGVGRMGAAMARRLRETHEVLAFDVRPGLDVGVPMVATPAALAERCGVVLLSLPSPRETRALFEDAAFRHAFEAGHAIAVDTSTSDPASLRTLVAELGVAGSRVIDAPVLGRPDRCGAWTFPVGGDPAAVEQARPILERLAVRVERVGEVGAGHTVKLLNNLMFAAINVATAEAIAACDTLGLDPARFVDLIAGSQAATVSPLFRDLAPRMLGEEQPTLFTVALLAKDLQLAARMCEDAGAALVSARASQVVVEGALELGLGEEDSAALIGWYRRGA
jgi:3-hydroxyisobutyrate dehydrogenase-like beta-hydroxyacid dehydrogenase